MGVKRERGREGGEHDIILEGFKTYLTENDYIIMGDSPNEKYLLVVSVPVRNSEW